MWYVIQVISLADWGLTLLLVGNPLNSANHHFLSPSVYICSLGTEKTLRGNWQWVGSIHTQPVSGTPSLTQPLRKPFLRGEEAQSLDNSSNCFLSLEKNKVWDNTVKECDYTLSCTAISCHANVFCSEEQEESAPLDCRVLHGCVLREQGRLADKPCKRGWKCQKSKDESKTKCKRE